jgi:hypothetical protein
MEPLTTDSPLISRPEEPKGRSVLGIILGLLLLFALSGFGLVYYLYVTYLDGAQLKKQFEEQVAGALGLPVQVREIRLSFPTVHLHDVTIGNPTFSEYPRLELTTISATPDVWELLSGKVIFENLSLASISIHLTRNASGSLVLPPVAATAPGASPSSSGAPEAFPLRNLDARGVSVHFTDAGLGKTLSGRLEKADVTEKVKGSPFPQVAFSGEGSLQDLGRFAVTGETLPDAVVSAAIQMSDLTLAEILPLLPPTVQVPAGFQPQSAALKVRYGPQGHLTISDIRLSGKDLTLTGKAETSSFSPLNGSAEIEFSPLALGTLLPLIAAHLPESAKSLKIPAGTAGGGIVLQLASGSLINLRAWAAPQKMTLSLDALGAPLENVSGKISYQDGTVSWENLELGYAQCRARSAKGSLNTATLKGQSALAFTLNAEPLLKAVHKYLPADVRAMKLTGALEFAGTITLAGADSVLDGTFSAEKFLVQAPGDTPPIAVNKLGATLRKFGRTVGDMEIDKLEVKILDTDLLAKGTFANGPVPQFKVTAEAEADLAVLHAALPINNDLFKKQTKITGKARVNAVFSGSPKKPVLDAKLTLNQASFAYPEKKLLVRDIEGTLLADLNSVRLEKLSAGLAGGKLQIDGRLDQFTTKPVLNATGSMSGTSLGEIRDFLGHNFPTFPKELDFSGRADLEVGLSGPADQPRVKGTAVLAGMKLVHPALFRPLTDIIGPIRFDNTTIHTENLQMNWGSSTMQVAGKVEDISTFKLAFTYGIQPLDLTDIAAFFLKDTGYKATGSGNGTGKISGPIDKIVIEGTAILPTALVEAPISKKDTATFKFPLKNFTAPFRFTEGVLALKQLKAGVFSGTIEGSGNIFVKETPIRFALETKGTGLETNEFLALNTTMKNVVQGPIDVHFSSTGNTTGLDSLAGNWGVTMKQGKYQSPPVVAQGLALLNASHLSSGDLTGINGVFVFKDGKMNSNDLLAKSPFGNASFKGTVGLDTTLNGVTTIVFNQQAIQSAPMLKQISLDGQTAEVPIGVKGSLLSPSLDLKLDKLLEKAAKKQITNVLQDALFGKNKNQPTTASGTPATGKIDPGKLLMDNLGKILNPGKNEPAPTPPSPSPTAAPVPAPPTPPGTPSASPTPSALPTPSPTPSPTPTPLSPEKQIKQDIKKIQKDLKNIFKFK